MHGREPRCKERQDNGKKAAENIRGGREENQDQVWALPCHWTSTGYPVPDPSQAVSVPGKRFPRGRSCSCNAPRGAELRMGPSPAAASTPTSASEKKPKTHSVTEVTSFLAPPLGTPHLSPNCLRPLLPEPFLKPRGPLPGETWEEPRKPEEHSPLN